MPEKERLPDPPRPLSQPIRLLLALSALAATQNLQSQNQTSQSAKKWYAHHTSIWVRSICKLATIDYASLPPSISPEAVRESTSDQVDDWSEDEQLRIAGILVEASLAGDPDKDEKTKAKETDALKYTPLAKALSHKALECLGLKDPGGLLGEAEKNLANTLFKALKAAQEGSSAKIEESREKQVHGWGGKFGRQLATGAGVIAGGVLIGVTGGLAAPAIAALLAPLGIGGLLAGGAAPVVLGTLFGVGGGGLAGRRVRERWRGVEEFGFVEIGAGTKATVEEVEDLKLARERYQARKKKGEAEEKQHDDDEGVEASDKKKQVEEEALVDVKESEETEKSEKQVAEEVEHDRLKLEEKLLSLSLSTSNPEKAGISESPRQSLDQPSGDKDIAQSKKAPSLTATIVVPGLLTVSKTEAITAWRAICGPDQTDATPAIQAAPKDHEDIETLDHDAPRSTSLNGWKDGRDVYLLRFETAAMLKSGRDIDHWVTSKLKSKIKGQIIKRTVLSAYFAAVALPMTAYSLASMSLDNTWMQAQDRAKKAGRLLGEVLEKRVQGERPVVLIGTSLGALTILHALQYLASLPTNDAALPGTGATGVPAYVESAYLISLPSAPTQEEWSKMRSVVARRVVNAYSESDWVLAGVVRLHEVVTRAATLSSGIKVAGIGPVEQPGVQDVDISSVLKGHMEIQTKLPDILEIINVDA